MTMNWSMNIRSSSKWLQQLQQSFQVTSPSKSTQTHCFHAKAAYLHGSLIAPLHCSNIDFSKLEKAQHAFHFGEPVPWLRYSVYSLIDMAESWYLAAFRNQSVCCENGLSPLGGQHGQIYLQDVRKERGQIRFLGNSNRRSTSRSSYLYDCGEYHTETHHWKREACKTIARASNSDICHSTRIPMPKAPFSVWIIPTRLSSYYNVNPSEVIWHAKSKESGSVVT